MLSNVQIGPNCQFHSDREAVSSWNGITFDFSSGSGAVLGHIGVVHVNNPGLGTTRIGMRLSGGAAGCIAETHVNGLRLNTVGILVFNNFSAGNSTVFAIAGLSGAYTARLRGTKNFAAGDNSKVVTPGWPGAMSEVYPDAGYLIRSHLASVATTSKAVAVTAFSANTFTLTLDAAPGGSGVDVHLEADCKFCV